MTAEEMLPILVHQLRNNFTLTENEESMISAIHINGGGGIQMPLSAFVGVIANTLMNKKD